MATQGETLQDHIKTLENNIQNGISEEEVIATNHATEFLNNNKNKKTEINEKVQEKIDESKTKLVEGIKTDQSINPDKINKLSEAQTQAYINIMNWLDNKDLSDIKSALETKQQEIKEQQEEKRLNEMLQGPYTKETATNFIENTSKEDFNKILDKIVNKQNQPVTILGSLKEGEENTENISLTNVPEVGTQEYKLLQLITAYLGENDTKKIANIQISKATDAFKDPRFSTNERIISYDTYTRTKKEYKDDKGITKKDANGNIIYIYTWAKETPPTPTKLVRGDDRKMEETIAEQYQIMDFIDDGNFAKMSYVNDKTDTKKTGLNAFDDKGTFVKFEQFLKTKDTAYMSKNISTIIEALLAYKPQCVDNKPTEYKNGHAKALSDYMSTCTDTGIILTYLKYMTPNNFNLLGVDKPNRVANYNNVLFQDPKNNIMRPEVEKAINSIPLAEKEKILNNIAGVKNAITEKKSMSVGETINEGFNGLLDAFGPMLFGILKMFGIGKTTLYKRFPSAKEKIDTEFKKNYSLEKEAFDAINNIANAEDYKDPLDRTYKDSQKPNDPIKYPTGKYLKTQIDVDTYINTLATNSKNINVGVVNACVQMYNKTNNTSININDIVTIETTKIDGKEVKTIAGIKNDTTFTEVMTNYLQSDTPWDNIATANKNINIPHREDDKTISKNPEGQIINAQGLDIDSAQNYLITTKKQLVKYLTASLFSDKDLEYIMTENDLHAEIVNDNPPEPEKILAFDSKYVDNTGKVIDETKMIHEVITDIDKAPDNLIIVRNSQKISVTKKTNYKENDKTFTTYVAADGKRVKIYKNDSIQKPDNSTTIKPDNNTTNTPTENKTQPTAQVTTPTENTNTSQTSNNTVQAVPQQNHNGETTTEGKSQQTKIEITQDVPQDNTILETKLDENTQLTFGDNFPETQKNTWNKYYTTSIMEFNTMVDVYQNLIDNELKGKTISDEFIQSIKKDFTEKRENIKKIEEGSDNYTGNITILGAINFSDEAQQYKYNIKQNYLQKAVDYKIITQQEKDSFIEQERNNQLNTMIS